jgi:hypothetical protein
MARSIHRLSDREVVNKRKPGLYADGGGLYLQVARSQKNPADKKKRSRARGFSGSCSTARLGKWAWAPATSFRCRKRARQPSIVASAFMPVTTQSSSKTISQAQWRAAYRKIPEGKKRSRGDTDKTLKKRAN